MTTISLKNLVKKFGDNEVVHSINLEIEDGEFIVLVVPRDVVNPLRSA